METFAQPWNYKGHYKCEVLVAQRT